MNSMIYHGIGMVDSYTMNSFRRHIFNIFLSIVPELLLLGLILVSVLFIKDDGLSLIAVFPYLVVAFIVIRLFIYFLILVRNTMAIDTIRDLLSEFKRGRFGSRRSLGRFSELYPVLNDLHLLGKFVDSLITAQQNEINRYNEIYNNMLFSMSSYSLIINLEEEIQYANDGFLKKFEFEIDEIKNRKIDDIFYFVNARIRGAIQRSSMHDETVILEKIHLLSLNKISIIANVKVSTISLQGKRQIILTIDDITNTLRNDYQINLMHHISESMKGHSEITNLFYSILTGVTSGSGLGFNRAMLFLVSKNNDFLNGQMAVGPDSFEEAIEIWNSVNEGKRDDQNEKKRFERGKNLQEMVESASFSLGTDSLLTRALREQQEVHVYDSYNDPAVDGSLRDFLNVREFVVMPMVTENRSIGLLIADNKFNQVPIQRETIELLKIFAAQAATSIEGHRNMEILKKDMTRIEERQDAIVESEKMAAVGRIAAHIAHEIRNPLVTMGGYARRIDNLAKKMKNATAISDSANIILKESERLEKTLSNVMDFTRPSRQVMDYNNINNVVSDTASLLHNLFLERRVDVQFMLDENLPLIKLDFNLMKQVVLNLFQNSIDAMTSGGTITVTTRIDKKKEKVVLIVEDTGPGINEEDPNVIFEPFFTTKVTGVGLGLANVKKIVMDHDGEISVSNRIQGGASFILRFPFSAV